MEKGKHDLWVRNSIYHSLLLELPSFKSLCIFNTTREIPMLKKKKGLHIFWVLFKMFSVLDVVKLI